MGKQEQRAGRCPATTRHVPSHSLVAIGIQCKYTRGHDGDHAGYAGFGEGDVFWPQAQDSEDLVAEFDDPALAS